jgi:hypothetical protein
MILSPTASFNLTVFFPEITETEVPACIGKEKKASTLI